MSMLAKSAMHLLQIRLVGALGDLALLVEQPEHTHRRLLNQLQALGVVGELDVSEIDALTRVPGRELFPRAV